MAYQLDRFNGTFLVSVDDQTINSTATDLRFVGRNYSGYGEIENENFLHLLENFANTSAPPRAITGQTWFDSQNKKLKVYDGNKFKVVSGAESSVNPPAGLTTGDFWYDSVNRQIKVWTGDEFILVGPDNSPTYGETAVIPLTVKDSVGSNQQIITLQVGGEVIGVVSKLSFNLNQTLNPIPGFGEIRPGLNLINLQNNQTSSAHRFWGTASDSDMLGGFRESDFLKAANTRFSSEVSFSDNGYKVGDDSDLRVRILNGNSPTFESTRTRPIVFRITDDGADIRDVAVIERTGLNPGTSNLYNLGSNTARWNTVYANEYRGNTFYGTFVGTVQSTDNNTPLSFNNVIIGGTVAVSGTNSFNVQLQGGGVINLSSGTTGTIDNMSIGTVTASSAAFTTVQTSGVIRSTSTAESTSTSTGAIVLNGGIGLSGNIYAGGNIVMTGNGGLRVPVGTTANRPVTSLQGMIRFNTTADEWEGYDGTQWRAIGGDTDEDYGLVTGVADSFADYGSLV